MVLIFSASQDVCKVIRINRVALGYTRFALPRTNIRAYIFGKFFSCGIAGGAVEALAVWIFAVCCEDGKVYEYSYLLIFLSGLLWAVIAATLALASGSRYVAYGGSFVLYYFLVILNERYFRSLYYLHPHEWYAPKHIWILDEIGAVLLLLSLSAAIVLLYDFPFRWSFPPPV